MRATACTTILFLLAAGTRALGAEPPRLPEGRHFRVDGIAPGAQPGTSDVTVRYVTDASMKNPQDRFVVATVNVPTGREVLLVRGAFSTYLSVDRRGSAHLRDYYPASPGQTEVGGLTFALEPPSRGSVRGTVEGGPLGVFMSWSDGRRYAHVGESEGLWLRKDGSRVSKAFFRPARPLGDPHLIVGSRLRFTTPLARSAETIVRLGRISAVNYPEVPVLKAHLDSRTGALRGLSFVDTIRPSRAAPRR